VSFSFNFTVPSKEAARAEVVRRMMEVVASQNIHQRDSKHVEITAFGAIDLLHDDAQNDRSIAVSVSGSLGWDHNPGLSVSEQRLTSTAVAASAYYTTKV
jgi:siderophore synthetase component